MLAPLGKSATQPLKKPPLPRLADWGEEATVDAGWPRETTSTHKH